MHQNYSNLIIGYHGCDKQTFDNVLYHDIPLRESSNNYDWLGNGIYFWQNSYNRAYQWANQQMKQGKYTSPAVIGAVIDLKYCLDLTDTWYNDILRFGYKMLKHRLDNIDKSLPKNTDPGGSGRGDKVMRELDCAVIQMIHGILSEPEFEGNFSEIGLSDSEITAIKQVKSFDSIYSPFVEGKPVYPGSDFHERTHIQICVRNTDCIIGYFKPKINSDT